MEPLPGTKLDFIAGTLRRICRKHSAPVCISSGFHIGTTALPPFGPARALVYCETLAPPITSIPLRYFHHVTGVFSYGRANGN